MHRDVKPANVLLARPRSSEPVEHVYLSDFGLTKRSASDSAVTGTGQFVGTLDYAAPEQFKGETPDARTDVYSLGCVLFECLTGRPPFRSENDAGLMYAHLQQPPPPVTSERPDLPHEIDRGRAAMAKSPDDRPRSAANSWTTPLEPSAERRREKHVDRRLAEEDTTTGHRAGHRPRHLRVRPRRGEGPCHGSHGSGIAPLSEEGVDLILVPAIFVDVNAVAADFPDTRYVAIDFTGRPSPSLPNVSYVSFAQSEGSFLVVPQRP